MKNGDKGDKGDKGDTGEEAKINGVNSLTIVGGENITTSQDGSTFTINANKQTDNNFTDEEKTKLANLSNYDDTEIKEEISKKVDKVEGKSLISDSEISRLANVTNYDDTSITNRVTTIENKQTTDENNISSNTNNINILNGNIATINGKIPNQATSENQLADKDFVNSSITTNTANFIGTFNSVSELEAYSGTKTNNDYAFVIGTDEAGNTQYLRYKYNGTEWKYEYTLNNSSFTAAQWASIQSGITSALVDKLNGIEEGANKVTKTSQLTNDSGFLTEHQDISGKEDITNKVKSISSTSTDTEYPSAKAVYDVTNDLQTEIDELQKHSQIYECGVRIQHGQSSTQLERLGYAIGKTAKATLDGSYVENDFDNIAPFSTIREEKRDRTTHKLLAVKGEDGYDDVDGDVFIHYPDTYWKFVGTDDYYEMWVCNVPLSGYTKVDEFCVGKYPLVEDDDGNLCTKSGYQAKGWTSLTSFRTLVQNAYGENACVMDWRYDVITAMYLIEFANFNSQSVLGARHSAFRYNFSNDKALIAETSTNRIIINTTGGNAFIVGQQIGLGTSDGGTQIAKCRTITSKETYNDGTVTGIAIYFDGDTVDITTSTAILTYAQFTGSTDNVLASSGSTANNGKVAHSYRGFESNSIYDWIDGNAIVNGVYKICYEPSSYTSSTFTDYEDVNIGFPSVTSGYIKDLGFDVNHPFMRRPVELGGGSSTYISDYCWNNPSGTFACRVGGYPSYGAAAGLFCFGGNSSFGATYWASGARVLLYNL